MSRSTVKRLKIEKVHGLIEVSGGRRRSRGESGADRQHIVITVSRHPRCLWLRSRTQSNEVRVPYQPLDQQLATIHYYQNAAPTWFMLRQSQGARKHTSIILQEYPYSFYLSTRASLHPQPPDNRHNQLKTLHACQLILASQLAKNQHPTSVLKLCCIQTIQTILS